MLKDIALTRDAAVIIGPSRRRRVRMPAAWQVILVVGLCLIAAYFAVPVGRDKDLAYDGIGIASTVVMLVVIRRRRPAEGLGWYLLAAANACFVMGDGVYLVYDQVLHQAPPFPSVADAVYLAGYPFLAVGVWRVSHVRGATSARAAWVDAGMVSVGALALCWQLLMDPYADDATAAWFGKLVTMAYPVMDIGIVFIVVRAMMSSAARRGADSLLAAAVLAMLVSDFVYDLLVLHSSYTDGNIVDGGFLLNYVLLATAVAHPSMAHVRVPADERTIERTSWLRLVAIAAFVSPAMVFFSSIFGWHADADVLAATSLVLAALATLRVSWLFRQLRRQTAELKQRETSLQDALTTQLGLADELRHQAFQDSLTGLANRALLHDRAEHALEASPWLTGNVAVCFIGLDHFKGVNDSLGHGLGDQALVTVSKRLVGIVHGGDTVARLGGDEFAILLNNAESFDTVTFLAERIVSIVREPITIDGHQIHLSASVGVAFAGTCTTIESLLSEADAAMHEAKTRGGDRFALFETAMRSRVLERTTLTNSFQHALQNSEFFIEYQPQVRLADGVLDGFEALVRWQHPTLGLVGPCRFIPLAEETGFIVPLGRWVLQQACLEAAQWPSCGDEPITLSVNVSGRQFQDANLLEDVTTALASSGLSPHRLVLEITETVLALDQDEISLVLNQFKEMGIRIAVDDFGTGYSSLSYLRDFPVDILKIDKSFVELLQDPSSEGTTLVRTILNLAEDLHLETTAEGIEYPVQREALERLHCDTAQGYLISPPLGDEAARRYIAAATADLGTARSAAPATQHPVG
jgi:diguanylate cyclase (GGDEF)-like protein